MAKSCGVMKEEDYPYIPKKGMCHEDAKKVVAHVISGQVIKIPDEDTLLKNLATIGPLAVGLSARDLIFYNAGILHPDQCIGAGIDHMVVLVGYGEENGTKFWIIKNCFGKDWGEQGYLRLLRGVNACQMGTSYTASAILA